MTAALRLDIRCNAAGIIAILLVLGFFAPPASSGELSEKTVTSARELNLPDLSGQRHNLEEFTGKVLLVNFWASWCRPCVEEMSDIRRLIVAMRGQPFAVIGVNVGETQRRAGAAVKRLQIEFPVLLDMDSAVFKDWGASVLPTTYVLDRRGRVRYVGTGPLEWDRLDIVEMLSELAQQ